MAFKSLKQKWLQQFQELQHDQKIKTASSTHGGEGSTQHQGPAADAASKPTVPQQRVEQGAKTSNSQAASRPQEALNRKQRQQDGARPPRWVGSPSTGRKELGVLPQSTLLVTCEVKPALTDQPLAPESKCV
jgi:hypothetical protein